MFVRCTQNMRGDGSSFTLHQPCKKTNNGVLFKPRHKRLHSLIQNHVRHERSESAQEQRTAPYKMTKNNVWPLCRAGGPWSTERQRLSGFYCLPGSWCHPGVHNLSGQSADLHRHSHNKRRLSHGSGCSIRGPDCNVCKSDRRKHLSSYHRRHNHQDWQQSEDQQ